MKAKATKFYKCRTAEQHTGGNPMKDQSKTKQVLIQELVSLRQRTAELEQSELKHQQAEKTLHEVERLQRLVFEHSSDVIYTLDCDLRVTSVSTSVERHLGYRTEELVGRQFNDINVLAPESLEAAFKDALQTLAGGTVPTAEYVFIRKDGSRVIGEVSGSPLVEDGKIVGLISVARNITERKRAEEEFARVNRALRMLSDTNQALIQITDETALLNEVCRIVVDVGGYRMAWVGFAEHDEAKTLRPAAHAGFDSGYIESANVSWADNERGRGPGGVAIHTGQPSMARNIPEDPAFAPWREEAIWRGYQSIIALPLISEGLTLGALGIYAGEADAFDVKEAEILKELADDLAFGITSLRTRAKRDFAEEALRHSEKEKTILSEIANIFLTIPDEAMYGEVLAVVLHVINSKFGIFGYIGENGDLVIPSLTKEICRECQVPGKSIVFPSDSWGDSLWGRAIREKRAFYSDGPFHTPKGHIRVDHFLTMPIVYGQETIGLISIANKDGGYTNEDKDLLERIASYISPILNARLQRDVQERKRGLAVEALRNAEREKSAILDAMSELLLFLDTNMRVIWSNNAVHRQFNMLPDQLEGKYCYEALHGLNRPCRICPVAKVIETGGPCMIDDFSSLGKRWTMRAYPVKNEEEKVVGIVEIVTDITKRKRAEEALKESEQHLQSIIQGSPIPSFVIGNDHKVIYWNKALEELSGIKAEEVTGTRQHWRAFYSKERPCLADILVDDDTAQIPLLYQGKYSASKFLEGAYEATDFFPELGENGKWLRFTAAAIRNSQGNLVGAIETLEDITDRKRAEEALMQTEEKYRSIFENSVMGIFQTTLEGRIISANQAFARILGYESPDEIMSTVKDVSRQLYVYPEQRAEFLHCIEERGIVQDFQVQFFRKNRSIAWITVNARAVRDSSGKLLYIEGANQDITDQKILETQLRQAQKMEAIGTLAGGIAHDFNNILSAIMGYTDMALSDHKLDDNLRHYLNQVFRAGERARDLVKQILTFSRQSDEKLRPLRVSPIIKEVLKLLKASLPSTIIIRQEIQPDPDTVLADPTHVHQMLMNLCTNAAHAMRERKGELKVTLSPVEIKPRDALIIHHGLTPGRYLKLAVSDTGVGVAPEIMDRIFDPFFTTKKPGEGTGMGLSVVHGIVKSYNGAITVESEVRKGTEFRIYLPLLMETECGQEIQAAVHIPGGKECILFVDDEEVLVDLGMGMLTGLGYEVVGRTSSLEALELFRAKPNRFDLVITDMTMPSMTGSELAQEIMRMRPDVPVILCTGFSETITPEKVKAIGLKDFVMKPLIKHQIAAVIRRALDQKD